MSVRFSQKDFRRGVDDAMTLAPLREAVRSITIRVMRSGKPSSESKESPSGRGMLTVTLSDREDGGVRVQSADLPGLILSGADKHAVLNSIAPAIAALLEHRGFEGVTVKAAKSLPDMLNGKNPQDVDMHVQISGIPTARHTTSHR